MDALKNAAPLLTALVAAVFAAAPMPAAAQTAVSVTFGSPHFGLRIGTPVAVAAPVPVVAPPVPVYVPPLPVYGAPVRAYVPPVPVYVSPAPVLPPVYAPVMVPRVVVAVAVVPPAYTHAPVAIVKPRKVRHWHAAPAPVHVLYGR